MAVNLAEDAKKRKNQKKNLSAEGFKAWSREQTTGTNADGYGPQMRGNAGRHAACGLRTAPTEKNGREYKYSAQSDVGAEPAGGTLRTDSRDRHISADGFRAWTRAQRDYSKSPMTALAQAAQKIEKPTLSGWPEGDRQLEGARAYNSELATSAREAVRESKTPMTAAVKEARRRDANTGGRAAIRPAALGRPLQGGLEEDAANAGAAYARGARMLDAAKGADAETQAWKVQSEVSRTEDELTALREQLRQAQDGLAATQETISRQGRDPVAMSGVREQYTAQSGDVARLEQEIMRLERGIFDKQSAAALGALSKDELAALDEYLNANVHPHEKLLAERYTETDGSGEARAKQFLQAMGYSDRSIEQLAEYRKYQRDAAYTEADRRKLDELAAEHPILTGIGNTVFSTLGNVIGAPGAAMDALTQNPINKYAPLNTNNWAFSLTNDANAMREDVMGLVDWNVGGYDLFDAGYGIVTSTADSIAAAYLGGGSKWLGSGIIGLEAGVQNMVDITERGGTAEQAILGGIAAGVFETLFESFSIGNFNKLKETPVTDIRSIAGNIGKSMLVNGSEEAATEIANIIYDYIALGDISNYAQMIEDYTAQGYSEKEAKRLVAKQLGLQVLEAGVTGAIQGGFMSGAGMGISAVKGNTARGSVRKANRAIDAAYEAYSADGLFSGEAQNAAWEALGAGAKAGYLADQQTATNRDFQSEMVSRRQIRDLAKDLGKVGNYAMNAMYIREVNDALDSPDTKMPVVSTADYAAGFLALYNAGRNGKAADSVTAPAAQRLSAATRDAAWQAGAVDARAENVAAERMALAERDESGYTVDNQSMIKEDTDYGEGRDAGRGRDTGRENSLAAREPGSSVEGRAGETESGGRGGAQAERAAEIRTAVQAEKLVSTASEGISAGTSRKTMRIVASKYWTDDMRRLSREQGKKGRHVIYFAGEMEMRDAGGTFTARGAVSRDGKRIWVRADHESLTVEQIIRHEEYHAAAMRDYGLNRRLKAAIVDRHGAEGLAELTEVYTNMYFTDRDGNVTAEADYILEEILADAYAEIDVLGDRADATAHATAFASEAQAYMRESMGNENAAREGSERTSREKGGQHGGREENARTGTEEGNDQGRTDGEFETISDFRREAEARGNTVVEMGGRRGAADFRLVETKDARAQPRSMAQELERLNVPCVIYADTLRLYSDGKIRTAGPDASTICRQFVAINNGTNVNPINAAGHEAFHFWGNTINRENYWESLENNIRFGKEKFREYADRYVNEKYFPYGLDFRNKNQTKQFFEEVYAYISGDIHEGTHRAELSAFIRDYDAVAAAWKALVESQSETAVGKRTMDDVTADSGGDTRFSRETPFSTQVDQAVEDPRKFEGTHLFLGETPKVLTDLGITKLPMLMTAKHAYLIARGEGIYKGKGDHYHDLGAETLKKLPQAIAEAVMVMESASRPGDAVVLTSLVDKKGRPVIAAIHPNGHGNVDFVEIDANVMTSAYGRVGINDFIQRAVDEDRVLFFDEKRSHALNETPGVQFPDNLAGADFNNSIRRFKKNVNRDTRFSREESGAYREAEAEREKKLRQIEAENAALREQMADATAVKRKMEQMMYVVGAKLRWYPEYSAVKKLSRQLKSDFGSKVETEWLTDKLMQLYSFIQNGRDAGGNPYSYDAAMKKAQEIAGAIVENAVHKDDALYTEWKEVRDRLRKTRITIAEQDRADVGNYSEFRKKYMGRLNLVNEDGLPVDVLYDELSERYPGTFPEDIVNPGDQLLALGEFLDTLKITYKNPFEGNFNVVAQELANDVFQRFWSVPQIELGPGELVNILDERAGQVAKVREWKKAYVTGTKARVAEIKQSAEQAIAAERRRQTVLRQQLIDRFHEQEERRRLGRTAAQVREQIRKTAGRLSKRLTKPTDKQHIPEQLRTAVAAVLDAVNLESAWTRGEDGLYRRNDEGAPTARTETFRALREVYRGHLKDRLVLDPDLLGGEDNVGLLEQVIEMRDIRIADMSLEQLEIVQKTLSAIEASVRNADALLASEQYESLSGMADAFRQDMEKRKDKQFHSKRIVSAFDQLMNFEMVTPADFLEELGGAGVALRTEFWQAAARETKLKQRAVQFAKGLYGDTDTRTWSGREAETRTFNLENGSITLTPAQIMLLYLTDKRAQGRRHIYGQGIKAGEVNSREGKIKGRNPVEVSQEEVRFITDTLTDAQKKVADRMGRFMSDDAAEWMNETTLRLFGYKKFTERNYVPIRTDENSRKSAPSERVTDIEASIANAGMTKATVDTAVNPIILGDIFEVFFDHVNKASIYAAWLPALKDADRFFDFQYWDSQEAGGEDALQLTKKRTGSVQQDMENKLGEGAKAYYKKLVRDLNGGARAEGGSGILDWAVSNYKAAAIGASARVVIQQPTSIFRAAAMIDPKYLIEGVPGNSEQEMLKWSPIAVWKDWGYTQYKSGRQLRQLAEGPDSWRDNAQNIFTFTGGAGNVLENIKDWSMRAAGRADMITWSRLWNACKLEILDTRKDLVKGSDAYYRAVAARFEEIIYGTQVVDSVLTRSQAMRSTNATVRMATSFMSEPTRQYNMLRTAALKALHGETAEERRQGRKQFARTALSVTVANLVNAVVVSLYDALGDDDDDESYWLKWWQAMIGLDGSQEGFRKTFLGLLSGNIGNAVNPLSWVYYAKDALSLMQGYDVTRMDMAGMARFVQSLGSMRKALSGKGSKTVGYAALDLVSKAADLLGIPMGKLKRDVEHLVMAPLAEIDPTGFIEYSLERAQYKVSTKNNDGDIGPTERFVDMMLRFEREGKQEAARKIYNDLVNSGVTPKQIEAKRKARYKEEQGKVHTADILNYADVAAGYKVEQEQEETVPVLDQMTAAQQTKYYDMTEVRYNDIMAGIEDYGVLSKLDAETQDALARAALSLSQEQAKAGALDGEYQVQTKWMLWADGGEAYGVDETEAILFKVAYDMTEGTKDRNGNIIAGSKKENVLDAVDDLMPWLTRKEKDYLQSMYWSGKKTYEYMEVYDALREG